MAPGLKERGSSDLGTSLVSEVSLPRLHLRLPRRRQGPRFPTHQRQGLDAEISVFPERQNSQNLSRTEERVCYAYSKMWCPRLCFALCYKSTHRVPLTGTDDYRNYIFPDWCASQFWVSDFLCTQTAPACPRIKFAEQPMGDMPFSQAFI